MLVYRPCLVCVESPWCVKFSRYWIEIDGSDLIGCVMKWSDLIGYVMQIQMQVLYILSNNN